MKKVLALSMVLLLTLLTACGGGESPAPASQEAPAETETAAESPDAAPAEDAAEAPAADAALTEGDPFTIKVSHAMTAESSYHRAIDQEFKQPVEAKSGGRITVELYPSAQLGAERQSLEAVGLGTIEMCIVATPNVANIDPNFSIFDFPFLFFNTEAGYAACDGEIGDTLNETLTSYGYKNLGFGEVGMRYITNSKNPISKPEDLQGMKLRCMENPIHIAAFKALGANPTPMAINELFTGLQQKTVDGQENPPAIIYDNKFNEVQGYLSKTGHFYHPLCFIVNNDWFNNLSEADQALIAECGLNAALKQREFITADNVVAMDAMIESGIAVNDVSDEEKQVFMDAVQSVYDEFGGTVADGLIDKAKALN